MSEMEVQNGSEAKYWTIQVLIHEDLLNTRVWVLNYKVPGLQMAEMMQ